MNLAHTHLTPNYISVKDYYIFRLLLEYVIIPLLASLLPNPNPLHAKTVFYGKGTRNAEIYKWTRLGQSDTTHVQLGT